MDNHGMEYSGIADISRRISFLENKESISLIERKELAILELARVVEYKDIGRELMSRQTNASGLHIL
ncbi:MAG: hypothetical protein KAH21_00415 [Spirochaetaceae bacterium]|nr:hypothetical protein [Spirochaetaceae bacterium]